MLSRAAAVIAALAAGSGIAMVQPAAQTGGQSLDVLPPATSTVQPQPQPQLPGQEHPVLQPPAPVQQPVQQPAMAAPAQPPVQPPGQGQPPGQAQTPAAQQPVSPGVGSAAIVPRAPEGQWLATDYINTPVYGSSGEIVAYVGNLLLDGQGRVAAVIITYNAGFLGLGGKNVAVPFSALRIAVADGRALLRIDATRGDLERAPAYVRELR